MEIGNAIAGLSAIGSLAAALWARSSAICAKDALKLAQADYISRQEDLSTYLIDAMKWHEDESQAYLSASCSITNSSSTPTTLKQIELLVHAIDQEGKPIQVYVPAGGAQPKNSKFSVMAPPINLEARASFAGWISFRLPEAIKNHRAERYELIFHTWSGQRFTLNIYQVKSIS